MHAADNCLVNPPCPNNQADDVVTVFVDNTLPVITSELTDVDPIEPGIQVTLGTVVSWTAEDEPPKPEGEYASGVVGMTGGSYQLDTPGSGLVPLATEDWARNHVNQSVRVTVRRDEDFRLDTPVVREGQIQLSFPTLPDVEYTVLTTESLDSPWSVLTRVLGTGSPVIVWDPLLLEPGQRFYQVARNYPCGLLDFFDRPAGSPRQPIDRYGATAR